MITATGTSPIAVVSVIEVSDLSRDKTIMVAAKNTTRGKAYLKTSEAMQTFLALLSEYSLSAMP